MTEPTLTIFLAFTDEVLIDMAELVLERRAGLRSNGERIREVVRLKELQHHFISYRSKVRESSQERQNSQIIFRLRLQWML